MSPAATKRRTDPLAGGVPPLGPPPRVRKPRVAERTLASGLKVVAVRQAGVPLVEVRLRIPFAGRGTAHPARASLLADTLLAGTAERSQVRIAEELQGVGAELSVSNDADRLVVSGAVLATGLPTLLDVVADVLTAAAYPQREVRSERDRLTERITVARAQPTVLVNEALHKRMYGNHPYARELPTVEAVRRVSPAVLRTLHAERVVPAGSVLVLVGDLSPARVLDRVERAVGGWHATAPTDAVAPPVPALTTGPTLLVDRPGSVQSSIRIAGPAPTRHDPSYPAFQAANLIFGGYFSSRMVENIREDKGYSYSPASRIDHAVAGSSVVVQAEVATEVTAPALLEIGYELGKVATLPATQEELDSVRQYAIGTLALSVATQAGLASTLAALAGVGLGLDWLRAHSAALAKVTLEETFEQAGRWLTPSGLVQVVLGEAETVEPSMSALGRVEVAAGD